MLIKKTKPTEIGIAMLRTTDGYKFDLSPLAGFLDFHGAVEQDYTGFMLFTKK